MTDLLENFPNLKKKLLDEEISLYKSKIIFISIAIHYENVINQSTQLMKKTLTQLYTPNKSHDDEKEGELYKQVQAMIVSKSPELDIIWQYIYDKSLLDMKHEKLIRIANMSSNTSMQHLDPFNNSLQQDESILSDISYKSNRKYNLINDSLMTSVNDDTTIISGASDSKMQQVEDSTQYHTMVNLNQSSHGTILKTGMTNNHIPQVQIGSFAKRITQPAHVLDASSVSENSIGRNVLKDVLITHAKVDRSL